MSLRLKAVISPGDLLDRITILTIKNERMTDAEKLRHVRLELAELTRIWNDHLQMSKALEQLAVSLKTINAAIWQIEDRLRDCERRQDFGSSFVELARAAYRHNDLRAGIKHQINVLLDSSIVEEKSHG